MAQTITFHQKLKLTFPEGFREMSQAERGNLTMIAEGPGSCLTDPERHIIVSVGWRSLGRWTALLLSAKDAAKHMAGSIRNAMAPYGCRVTRAPGKRIGGEKAEGVCFDYTAQGIGMYHLFRGLLIDLGEARGGRLLDGRFRRGYLPGASGQQQQGQKQA